MPCKIGSLCGMGEKFVFYNAFSLCQVRSNVEALITCKEASEGQSTKTIVYGACGHPGEQIGVFYVRNHIVKL